VPIAVDNPLGRTALQFLSYSCLALVASNLAVESNFNSKLNFVWMLVGAIMIVVVFKQGTVVRIAMATFLALTGFAVLALTATGELYWANWSPMF
jgi:hypothetical protein